MGSLSFEPLVPPSLWMALAVAAVAMLVLYAIRRPEPVGRPRWFLAIALMSAALATVLSVLLNPTWVTELPPPPGKPLLNVLVDDSGSMTVPDGDTSGTTRYQVATKLAGELTSDLGQQFDVRVHAFSETSSLVAPADLKSRAAKGQTSDLATALFDAVAEDRPQGQAIVVLSDGIHNAAGGAQTVLDAARRAKSLAAPVYTRTIGGGAAAIDLAVELRSPQDLAVVGQRVPVTVRVSGRGVKVGRADVSLLYDGKEVSRQSVTVPAAGAAASPEVRFWIKQDKIGLYPYEARIDPLPGESTQANNSATYLLRVIDQPIKVLLVEGKPYWDSKFLMRTLSGVPAVELESIVCVSDGRLVRRSITRKTEPPTTRPVADDAETAEPGRGETWSIVNNAAEVFASAERLRGIQVVVVGRDAEAFLTDQAVANLQNWVAKEGGALVCSRGSPTVQVNQRLAKLLPVKWAPAREARFRMRLTDEGRQLHWLGDDQREDQRLSALPTLASSAQVDRSKPLAIVLATSVTTTGANVASGGDSPAVVYQPYGTGRVIVIEGAGMWRWAFLPPLYQQKEEVYASLWHSMLRWVTSGAGLLPGQTLALRADKISFATDEPATATLLVREDGAKGKDRSVELIGPSSPQPRAFSPSVLGEEPGSFRVNFGKLSAGRYQARVVGAASEDVASRCVFDVKVIGQEQLDLQARPDLMARIAADASGATLGDNPVNQIRALFKEHLARTHPPRHQRATAWDRPWVLMAIFGLWTISWAVRRGGGLV